MQNYQNTVENSATGSPVSNVTITVKVYPPPGANATIYSVNDVGATPIAGSSVVTDQYGQFGFYAANGTYYFVLTEANGTITTTGPIVIQDNGLPQKAIPVDADKFFYTDSAAAFSGVFATWANLKSMWDGLYVRLSNLAASAGAALVGYLPAGTGAVATTVQGKLRESISILDFSTLVAGVAASNGRIYFPAGTYDLGATTLTIPNNCRIVGAGRNVTNFTYSGTGIAFDGSANSNIGFEEFSLTCSNDAATGIKLGGAAQHFKIDNVALYGTGTVTNTGTGLLLDATSTTNAFSGNLSTNLFYTLGFKYGIRFVGQTSIKTWTACSFSQTFLIGRGAGIIAGSVGFSIDSHTCLSGASFIGGTIESFDTGLSVATNADNINSGIEWDSDIEGCNTNYTVGTTFHGRIYLNPAAKQYQQSTNGSSNVWTKQLNESGVMVRESYYSQLSVLYQASSNLGWQHYFGASKINAGSLAGGGSPALVWGVDTSGNFATTGSITTTSVNGVAQKSTVGSVTVTSCGIRTPFAIPNSKSMTFSPFYGSVFVITIGATGEAGVFFASFASATITSLGPLPVSIELSSTPAAGHIGLSKSGGSNTITVTSGATASGLTNMSISVLGSDQSYALPTDWV